MCGTIALIFTILSIILGFVAKILAKKRMSESLGRQATDHDLSSIGSWMKVEENEKKSVHEKKQ